MLCESACDAQVGEGRRGDDLTSVLGVGARLERHEMGDRVDGGHLGRVAQQDGPARYRCAVGVPGVDVAVVGSRHQLGARVRRVEVAGRGVRREGVVDGVDVVAHRMHARGDDRRGALAGGRFRVGAVDLHGEPLAGLARVVPRVEVALGVGRRDLRPAVAVEVGDCRRAQEHGPVDRAPAGLGGGQAEAVGVHRPTLGLTAVLLEGVHQPVAVGDNQLAVVVITIVAGLR